MMRSMGRRLVVLMCMVYQLIWQMACLLMAYLSSMAIVGSLVSWVFVLIVMLALRMAMAGW